MVIKIDFYSPFYFSNLKYIQQLFLVKMNNQKFPGAYADQVF
jgi:hypothetical protein